MWCDPRSTPNSTESDMHNTYGKSLRSTLLLPSILMEAGHQRGQRHREYVATAEFHNGMQRTHHTNLTIKR